MLSIAASFHKEDYLNLINMVIIKLKTVLPESVIYLVERKDEDVSVITGINENERKIDPLKIKDILSAAKEELSYIERSDIIDGEKTSFFVINLNSESKKISIISLVDVFEKEVAFRYFRVMLLFLKSFLNYYSEIEKRNIEIKKLKMEMNSIIEELENQETKLIKKHKERRIIYEGISTFTSNFENPVLYLIESIYRSILPYFMVYFSYNDEKNIFSPLFVQPSNIKISEEFSISDPKHLCVRAFLSGSMLYVTDKKDIDTVSFARDHAIKTMLIFPVVTSKVKYGVVVIGDKCLRRYSQDDISLIDIFVKYLGIFMNFSDLYKRLSEYAAKMENLNKIKDEFISSVNHEIKTPLTTIKGFLSVLLSGEAGALTDQQMSFLSLVDQATNRLINIVTNLLDISKLNSKSEMDIERGDLIDLLNTILPSLRMKAYFKNIRIDFSPDVKTTYVLMDKHWIGQVINNLVDNAIKYSPPSSIVTIKVYDKGEVVVVCVEDNGYGIDEEDRKFIFEKFFRGKNVFFNTEGSGLGLAIARTIIEKHNGKIWFESEKGKGSKFYFALKKA